MAKLAVDILAHFLCKILFGKEGTFMMAMLWAQQIMFGKKTATNLAKPVFIKGRRLSPFIRQKDFC